MGVLCCVGRCGFAGFLGCVFACTHVKAACVSWSRPGEVRVLLNIAGVYSYKSVLLEGLMTTEYDAGYVLPCSGERTLRTSWNEGAVAPGPNDVAAVAHDWGADIAGVGASHARNLMFSGRAEQWPQYDGAAWALVPCTPAVAERALCAPVAGRNGSGAYVLSDARRAEAPFRYNPSFGSWIIRLSAGISYDITEIFSFFLKLSYALDFNRYGDRNTKKDMAFMTDGERGMFKTARELREANLIKESFRYNKGLLASGVSVALRVEETLGVMSGVSWWPASILQLHAEVGIKRYIIEAMFREGSLAIPGTLEGFARTFTHDGARCKLLIAQDAQDARVLYAVKWPLVFGVGVRLALGTVSLTFDFGYTQFASKLESLSDDGNSSGTGAILSLEHPFTDAPGAGEVVDGAGVHQFKALDVRNVIHARVECEDWTFGVGCMVII